MTLEEAARMMAGRGLIIRGAGTTPRNGEWREVSVLLARWIPSDEHRWRGVGATLEEAFKAAIDAYDAALLKSMEA